VNFSAIPLNLSQTLGEKYKVHILGSSVDILDHSDAYLKKQNGLELILYGDIDYDNQNTNNIFLRDSISTDKPEEFVDLATRSGIDSWSYLAGTANEINNIKKRADEIRFQ